MVCPSRQNRAGDRLKKILDILPDGYRRRSLHMVLSLFARAGLNFAGLAALLPLLALLLDPAAFEGDGTLSAIYARSGIGSPRLFAGAVCLGAVLFTLLKAAATFRLARFERRCLLDLYRTLSRQLYITYHDCGLAFIDTADSVTLTRNVNGLTRTFVFGVLRPAVEITAEALLLLLLLGALALHTPPAALLAIGVFLPAGAIYQGIVRQRIARYGAAEHRASREKARIVSETFRGYADIELNGAFPEMLRGFDRAMDQTVRALGREADLNRLPPFIVETTLAVGLAVWAVGSFGREDSALWFGICAVAALRLMPSVRAILNGWTSIRYNRHTLGLLRQSGLTACGASPAESPGPAPETVSDECRMLPFEASIEVQGLSFRYPGGDREVLHGLSFTIRKGERVGIRGTSGVGKTTLFRLLAGLYEPTQGQIRIDGVPLGADNRRAWQQRIGYVPQRPFLRNGTIAGNVAPGVPTDRIDRRRVAEVLRTARLESFVASLPRGIDTPLGECGARLSGGQRQRIAIARALYRRVDVLFFDEATSSLDLRTETELLRSLEELAERNPHMTLFVIAHSEEALALCRRTITLGT